MKETKTAKRGLAAIYRLCPRRHLLLLFSAALILLHLVTRDIKPLMSAMSEKLVRPVHDALARFSALLPFSLAELLVLGFVLGLLAYLLLALVKLRHGERPAAKVYIIFVTLASAGLAVYAGFCFLWGVY